MSLQLTRRVWYRLVPLRPGTGTTGTARRARSTWGGPPDQQQVPAEQARRVNWEARVQLATAYRALHYYRMNEGICNHLSMMAPAADGSGDTLMLLLGYGKLWPQVTASSLVGVNDSGEVVEGEGEAELSAVTIHGGVHKGRPDARAVMHIHAPYTTALSCSKDPRLVMCHQNSMRFYANTVYDRHYAGVSSAESEGLRLAEVLGPAGEILVMGNHGILAAQTTVSLALDSLYYFERAAMIQVLAESRGGGGGGLEVIPEELCAATYRDSLSWRQRYADTHLAALFTLLNQRGPAIDS